MPQYSTDRKLLEASRRLCMPNLPLRLRVSTVVAKLRVTNRTRTLGLAAEAGAPYAPGAPAPRGASVSQINAVWRAHALCETEMNLSILVSARA
jgi:hypothetical protein